MTNKLFLELSSCFIDLEQGLIRREDDSDRSEVPLSSLETEVLEYLVQNRGIPVSSEQIQDALESETGEPSTRRIGFALHSLSGKIESRRAQGVRHLRRLPTGHYLFTLGLSEEPTDRTVDTDIAPVPSPTVLHHESTLGSNLSPEVDPFVGREGALADLWEMFSRPGRLITLLGPPGCGKSRLAVHFALNEASQDDRWPGGVWRVDVRRVEGRSDLADAISGTLRLDRRSRRSQEGLTAWLSSVFESRGRSLLLLDGADRLQSDAIALLDRCLAGTPDLLVLATSRQKLSLPREAVCQLGPMTVDESVELLTQRCSLPPLESPESDFREEALRAIAQRLDCIPLALELAAAQLRSMTAIQLLKRLEAGLGLPESPKNSHEESASLRAAISSSWDLLTSDERSVFAQTSVFRGGFSLPAAAAVVHCDGPIGEILANLCDKSLVTASDETGLGGLRFDIYAPLREFGRRKLKESGKYASTLLQHRHWFLSWGERQLELLGTLEGFSVLAALEEELGNFLAAYQRSEGTKPAVAARLALVIEWPLRRSGQIGLWQDVLDSGVRMATRADDNRLLAKTLVRRAGRLRLLGELSRANEDLAKALELSTAIKDQTLELAVRIDRADLLRRRDLYDESEVELERCFELAESCEDDHSKGWVYTLQGLLFADRGEFNQATQMHRLALGTALAQGEVLREAQCRSNLGARYMDAGRLEEAAEQFHIALETAAYDGAAPIRLRVLSHLGVLHILQAELSAAEAAITEAMALSSSRAEVAPLAWNGLNLGAVRVEQARLLEAGLLFEEAKGRFRELGAMRGEALALLGLGAVALLSDQTENARRDLHGSHELARSAGSRHVEFQAVSYLAIADRSSATQHLAAARALLSAEHPQRDHLFLALAEAIVAARSDGAAKAKDALEAADQAPLEDLGPDTRVLRTLLRRELRGLGGA